jgi:hypothetical protein
MKNILKYNFLFAAATIGLLSSCSEDDDKTLARGFKPTLTVDQTSFSMTEGDEITVNVTASQAINKSMEFKVELVGGTASFRDYTSSGDETVVDDGQGVIGHKFSIPAYTTDYSFTIGAVKDMLPEGAENMTLRIYSMGNANGSIDQQITVNIADFVSNDIAIELNWSKTRPDAFGTLSNGTYVGVDGDDHEFGDYDFDFYVFDAVTFDEVTGYAAATGASPEKAVLADADLVDGDYWIVPDLYDSGAEPEERFKFDIELRVAKYGVWYHAMPLNYYSDNAVSAPFGLNGGETYAAILTKAGTTYTLSDFNSGDVLASGRLAQLRERIKAIKKIRKK